MQEQRDLFEATLTCQAWNKGKIVGAKPPLRPKHVWSIRTRLQVDGRKRDLALFNLAIDSKLRGCDVVSIRVEDIAPRGHAIDRATVRQKKTGHPVKFELTEHTRHAIDDYLQSCPKQAGEFLFTGRRGQGLCLTTRQYARLVSEWLARIDLDPLQFWHSLAAQDQGHADLQAHRQFASRSNLTGSHQD